MNDNLLPNEPTILPRSDKFEQATFWFFWGALSVFLFTYGTRPIIDPDFWWHLKSGAVMIENRGLLQSDPFTFSGDGVVSAREAIILKGYWLWQITAYGLYSLFGFNGIFLLNVLTIGATAGVASWQLRRQQVSYALTALLLTTGFFLVSFIYPMERPQVVSFLFAAILLGILSRVRAGGELGWTLPLLMVVWANLHGGFVVGDLILLCFAAGAVLEYRQDLPRLRRLLFWVGVGIAASLINPNGALVFGEVFNFHQSTLMLGVTEYQSTWVKFNDGARMIAIFWLLIALYGVGAWWARRLYWPELLVALFLAYFSVSYMRNVGFFAIAMLPAIGFSLQQGARRQQWQLPPFVSLLVLSLCTATLLWFAYGFWSGRQGVGPVKMIYPEKAISFLHDSGLQGKMFNSYEYGGYLLWRLAPQIKVFIDGRGMETGVFEDWKKITRASKKSVGGRPEYEVLLDSYAIDYIIQPIYDGDGNIQPLMKNILNKSDWDPVYLDRNVYILARRTADNADTISAYRIDKKEFTSRLLLTITSISQSNPRQPGYQVARAGLLIYLGMYDEARAQIAAIMAISPNDRSLPALQRELEILSAKRPQQ